MKKILVIFSLMGCLFAGSPRLKTPAKILGPTFEKAWVVEKFGQNIDLEIDELISILRPISKKQISEQDHSIKIIWALRVLRYLTKKQFVAPTTARINFHIRNEERRFNVLKNDNDEYAFFKVWPSRVIVFLAPIDSQMNIIQQWKKWWYNNRKQYKFSGALDVENDENWDAWYY